MPGKNNVVADLRAAGNPRLSDNKAIFADFYVMAQVDEVVDFSSRRYLCRTKRRVVNTRAGTDFDVVSDFDVADLGNARMLAVFRSKAESFAADDGVGPDNVAFSQNAVFMDNGAGENRRTVTNGNVVANEHVGIDDAVFADLDVLSDNGVRHNGGICPYRRAFIDNRRRMDARLYRLARMKQHKELGKSQARIFYDHQGIVAGRHFFFNHNGAGVDLRKIFRIGVDGEGNILLPRFRQPFNIRNHGAAVANHSSAQKFC